MASISNQWLKNLAKRSTSFGPIIVKPELARVDTDWEKANNIVASLRFVRKVLDYQQVFTQQDLLDFLPSLVSIFHSIQHQIARFVLNKLSDKAHLEILKDRLENNLKNSE